MSVAILRLYWPPLTEELFMKIQKNIQILKLKYMEFFSLLDESL